MGFRIVGAVLLGIAGLCTMGWAFYTMARVNRMQRWPTTSGDMVSGEVVPAERGSGYQLRVRYVYTIDGHRYEGTTFGIQERRFSKGAADRLAERYAPERMVVVHHDPADPKRSFIDSSESQVPMVAGGIGLALVFIAVWIAARPWLLDK